MTDGDTAHEPGGRTGPNRSTLMVGGGLALVLLAAIGATGGWILAGADDGAPHPVAAPTATASRTTAAPDARPTNTRSQPAAHPAPPQRPAPAGSLPPVVAWTSRRPVRRCGAPARLAAGLRCRQRERRRRKRNPGVGEPISPGRTVPLLSAAAPAESARTWSARAARAADELVDDGFTRTTAGKTGVGHRSRSATARPVETPGRHCVDSPPRDPPFRRRAGPPRRCRGFAPGR